MTDDRARALAVQARHNRRGRTRLNLAITHLQGAQEAAAGAEMARQVRTLERLIGETTDLLATWPAPVRERLERAS
jgi:hypothetical protein